MGAPVKRIVLSGYYGFKNSGDEAVLQSILLALASESVKMGIVIEPIVLSIDPVWTSHTYGVQAVHRMKLREVLRAIRRSDGLISGGGSLLQDATGRKSIPYYLGIIKLAQWLGKPTFIYAQGIGPIYHTTFNGFIRSTFRKCKYISVRDEASVQLLQRIGVQPEAVEIVPDPVMGLPLRAKGTPSEAHIATSGKTRTRPVLGVSIRFWNKDHSELAQLARCLQIIQAESDVEPRFLPFHSTDDREASQFVIEQLHSAANVSLITDADHPQQMLAEVQQCDLLIGMRLHALIYAASQLVPMIGISYDPKIDQFLQRLGMEPAATTEQFDPSQVAALALQLLQPSGKTAWIAATKPFIEKLQAESHRPAQQISNYLVYKG